jgi:hypothetical protein
MRVALFALLALCAVQGAAQTTFKCTDENRRVTYSNTPCDKQGLRDAGPVAERTTTMPLGPPPAAPKPAGAPAPGAAKPPAARDGVETVQRGAQIKPVVPLLEKLSK